MLSRSFGEDAAAWIGVPLLFAATALGVGLLVERLLRLRLSEAALLPLGTCASMCGLLAVYAVGLHGWVPALVLVAAAAAGFVLARAGLRERLRPGPAAAAGAAVALMYLAPSVLSGHWTWYGYNFLNDTSVQFVLADALQHYGTGVIEGLRSTRGASLEAYVESGYPLGTHAEVATFATLLGVGVDVVYQSYLAMLAATAATALAGVARLSGLGPRSSAVAGAGAMTASLIYHYALQGSIKEVAAFTCLAAATLLGLELLRSDTPVRTGVALGIAAAAMVTAFSTAAGPYLVVLAAGLALLALAERGSAVRRRLPLVAATAAGVVLVAALPTLTSALTFLRVSRSALATNDVSSQLGQLSQPLEQIQLAGVWLSENYALPVIGPIEETWTYRLSWLVVVAAAIGAFVLLRRRAPGPLLLAGSALVAWQIVAPRASDYADAKLLALGAPSVVFLALCGALALRGRLRGLGVAVAAVACLATLASAAWAYHGVRIAPTDRMRSLAAAVDTVADRGPVMLDEVEEFAKYYGRRAPELNIGFESITVRFAEPFGGGYHVDMDELSQDYVQSYAAIVTRLGPATSRPPANFRQIAANRYYAVWERDPSVRVKTHLAAGSVLDAGGFLRCAAIRRLAADAAPGDRIVAAPARETEELPVSRAPDRPIGWPPLAKPPGVVEPRTPGVIEGEVRVAGGAYDVWVRGSTGRRLTVSVDGRPAGSVDTLNSQGQWLQAGRAELPAGAHAVRLERPGGDLKPGDGTLSVLGPVALVRSATAEPRAVAPGAAGDTLCGRRWDWVELVAG